MPKRRQLDKSVKRPLTLIPAAGGKMPPVHFCLCISKTERDTAMRFWDVIKDSEGYLLPYKVLSHPTGNVDMVAWKPEVHSRNQRKVSILNLPTKSNSNFLPLISYFHGHLTWICCWHGFLMSLFTGSAIWLTNINYQDVRKCMVWKCGSEMCDIHQEHVGFLIIIIYLFCS